MYPNQQTTLEFAAFEALRNDVREAQLLTETCRIAAERQLREKKQHIEALAHVLQRCFTEIAELKERNAALERICEAQMSLRAVEPRKTSRSADREGIEMDFRKPDDCGDISFSS